MGAYGDAKLVGNGDVTNGYCGKFARFKGCSRVDLHNLITLDGVNYAGKVFVRRVRFSCGKPSCPVCYKSGWAVREAENIKHRLVEASKRFGMVEHLVCSVPAKDYGLELGALRRKITKMLTKIGIIGGVMIFHAFRYNRRKGWYGCPLFTSWDSFSVVIAVADTVKGVTVTPVTVLKAKHIDYIKRTVTSSESLMNV